MPVVALANKKGGVGKTTMTIEMASGFALQGKKVLMIDFDPQCSSDERAFFGIGF